VRREPLGHHRVAGVVAVSVGSKVSLSGVLRAGGAIRPALIEEFEEARDLGCPWGLVGDRREESAREGTVLVDRR